MSTIVKHVTAKTDWWSEDNGIAQYWGGAELSYDVTLKLQITDSDEVELEATYKCVSQSLKPASQSGNPGYNTFFVMSTFGLHGDELKSSVKNKLFSDSHFVYRLGGSKEGELWTFQQYCESAANCVYGKSWDSVKHLFIAAVGVSATPASRFNNGLGVGKSVTYKKTITRNDVDKNYNLKVPYIMISAGHFWNYGNPAVTGNDINGNSISRGDFLFTGDPYYGDIDLNRLKYFPGEIKKSDVWYSHNRNAGIAERKSGNMWTPITNNAVSFISDTYNKGLIQKTRWTTQSITGVGMNERF